MARRLAGNAAYGRSTAVSYVDLLNARGLRDGFVYVPLCTITSLMRSQYVISGPGLVSNSDNLALCKLVILRACHVIVVYRQLHGSVYTNS